MKKKRRKISLAYPRTEREKQEYKELNEIHAENNKQYQLEVMVNTFPSYGLFIPNQVIECDYLTGNQSLILSIIYSHQDRETNLTKILDDQISDLLDIPKSKVLRDIKYLQQNNLINIIYIKNGRRRRFIQLTKEAASAYNLGFCQNYKEYQESS